MTVRRIDGDERSPRGGALSLRPQMAILTRHAVEAFPDVDMGAARCPRVRSGNHPRSMSQQVGDVVGSSPRLRTLSSSSSSATTASPARKQAKSNTRCSSFDKKGPTWVAATMLQSDLLVEVDDMSFHLHKFPLLSRSGRLNRLVFESRDTEKDHIKLDNMPGGASALELCIKFCYGIPVQIVRSNVATLRCAAEYLEMTEDLESHNLVSQTEDFLSFEVLTSWSDSIAVLRTCASLLPWAETLKIVKMCSESIAWKACTDPRGIRWSYSSASTESPSLSPKDGSNSSSATCSTSSKGLLPLPPHDWWFADVAELDFRSFKVVVEAIQAKGMRPDLMGSAILFYAHRWLPSLAESQQESPPKDKKKNKVAKLPGGSQVQERALLEGIVKLLPPQKDSVPVSGLLCLLRVAIFLDASPACKKTLETLAGMQLDQATLLELLIPSCPFRSDTFYDVGAVHRCLDHFLVQDHLQTTISHRELPSSSGRDDSGNGGGGDVYDADAASHARPPAGGPHTAKMKVAKLMDSYLAEIARDANLTFAKFQALAEALPEFSRITDDGLYRAIDTFLKAHPGLSEHERKKLCRMMDCQRLSLEACVHAAQNERLPLRIVVLVLFSEQLKLRNAISSTAAVRADRSADLHLQSRQQQRRQQHEASQPTPMAVQDGGSSQMDLRALQQDVLFMKARFAELQKDYTQVTQQVEKLTKQKGSWVKRLFQSKDNGEALSSSSPSHPRWSQAWRNSIS